jgi:anaerobic selenocysteine-containing dehydrogenase
MKRITPTASKPASWDSFNYYSNTPNFTVSYLKALYGDAATRQNSWAFDYLPKVDRNYSWVQMWDDMYRGTIKGMMAFGMNGVAIGPDSKKNINALKKADFLVVGEIYPDETSEFWRSPGITQDEMKQIQTTVYRLPCAGFAEKDGSFTNSARWVLWKNRVADARRLPAGPCDRGANFLEDPRAVQEGRRQVPRSDPEPDLELQRSIESVTGRGFKGDQW